MTTLRLMCIVHVDNIQIIEKLVDVDVLAAADFLQNEILVYKSVEAASPQIYKPVLSYVSTKAFCKPGHYCGDKKLHGILSESQNL